MGVEYMMCGKREGTGETGREGGQERKTDREREVSLRDSVLVVGIDK